jgi:hypothetical protein
MNRSRRLGGQASDFLTLGISASVGVFERADIAPLKSLRQHEIVNCRLENQIGIVTTHVNHASPCGPRLQADLRMASSEDAVTTTSKDRNF